MTENDEGRTKRGSRGCPLINKSCEQRSDRDADRINASSPSVIVVRSTNGIALRPGSQSQKLSLSSPRCLPQPKHVGGVFSVSVTLMHSSFSVVFRYDQKQHTHCPNNQWIIVNAKPIWSLLLSRFPSLSQPRGGVRGR